MATDTELSHLKEVLEHLLILETFKLQMAIPRAEANGDWEFGEMGRTVLRKISGIELPPTDVHPDEGYVVVVVDPTKRTIELSAFEGNLADLKVWLEDTLFPKDNADKAAVKVPPQPRAENIPVLNSIGGIGACNARRAIYEASLAKSTVAPVSDAFGYTSAID